MGLRSWYYTTLALNCLHRSDYEAALVLYSKALQCGELDVKHLAACGSALLQVEQYEKALSMFDRALDKNPMVQTRNLIRKNRALVFYKLGELDRAIVALEDLHYTAKNSSVYEILGYMYILKGDLDKALKYNLEAYHYDDEDFVIQDNLGQTYLLRGDLENARIYLSQALEQKDTQVDILYHMGLLEEADGNYQSALEYANRADAAKIGGLNDATKDKIHELIERVSPKTGGSNKNEAQEVPHPTTD